MKLPAAPRQYEPVNEAQTRAAIEQADTQNLKRQTSVTYLLMSKADGTVGKLTIDNTGAPIWTAL